MSADSSKPLIIGISGGSGSGKTSFMKDLQAKLPGENVTVVLQDDYYHPIEKQKRDQEGIENFDLPESIDHEAFAADIHKLMNGKPIQKYEYTFNNDRSSAKLIECQPAPLIIVEGLYIFFFKKIWELLDYRIFLHARESHKIVRRIKRDREERNYPVEDVLYRFENHVWPSFLKHIEPFRDEVDIVINNNESYEKGLEIIHGFVANYLHNLQ